MIDIDKEKQQEYDNNFFAKVKKEEELAEKISQNVQGDTVANVRIDSFMRKDAIKIDLTNKDTFWSHDGVVRIEYNLNDDTVDFNNSAGGTNSVDGTQIVDSYLEIYASAKNIIQNIKQNKQEYIQAFDEIQQMERDNRILNDEIQQNIHNAIDDMLEEKFSEIGLQKNSKETIEELLNKAEQEGMVSIFNFSDSNVRHELARQARNPEDGDPENAECSFQKSYLTCEISNNNAKRYYINRQFISKNELKETLENYLIDGTELTESLKLQNKSKIKVSFGSIEDISQKKSEHNDIQNFIKHKEDEKTEPKSRQKPRF